MASTSINGGSETGAGDAPLNARGAGRGREEDAECNSSRTRHAPPAATGAAGPGRGAVAASSPSACHSRPIVPLCSVVPPLPAPHPLLRSPRPLFCVPSLLVPSLCGGRFSQKERELK